MLRKIACSGLYLFMNVTLQYCTHYVCLVSSNPLQRKFQCTLSPGARAQQSIWKSCSDIQTILYFNKYWHIAYYIGEQNSLCKSKSKFRKDENMKAAVEIHDGPSHKRELWQADIHQTSPIQKEQAHMQRQSVFRKLCGGKS